MGAVARGGEDIAEFDLAVGDDDAVEQQFHEGATLREGGRSESRLHLRAEGLETLNQRGHVALLLDTPVEVALLGQQARLALGQLAAHALQLGQLDHAGDVGVEEPALLAIELPQGLLERGAPGLQLLRRPLPALRPRDRRGEVLFWLVGASACGSPSSTLRAGTCGGVRRAPGRLVPALRSVAAGEEHQSYAVSRSAAGAFHAPPEDQELLA